MKKLIKKLGRKISRSRLNPWWYQQAVGGRWREMGKLQFDFMYDAGLLPEDRLLDIGCGSLRGGLHFIRYLRSGAYFGIDQSQQLLNVGSKLLHKYNLIYKRPILECTSDFRASNMFAGGFRHIVAISLFTHINAEQIRECLKAVNEFYIYKDGCFWASFFENGHKPKIQPGHNWRLRTFPDKDPYHYSFEEMKQICKGTGLNVDYCLDGDWGHPNNQKMLLFYKENMNMKELINNRRDHE